MRFSMGPEQAAVAVLRDVLPTPAAVVTLRYALFVAPGAALRGASISTLQHNDGSRGLEHLVIFDDASDSLSLVEQEFTPGDTLWNVLYSAPLVRARWAEVVVTVDHSTSPWRATFAYDGLTVGRGVALKRTVSTAVAIAVELGTAFLASGTATAYDIDDVRIDITP
jgi:hypothetical protein